jgi:adenine phosphoribosyltransferase
MDINKINNNIRNVPDFPKPGIQFKDITTLLQNPEAFREAIEVFYNEFKEKGINTIVGVESRGFIFAAPLALKMGCSLVLARKPGKLPCHTITEEYELEYGTDAIQIHSDSINKGDKVLIVDDLLATGGTAKATGKIVQQLKGEIVSYAFLIVLKDLMGVEVLNPNSVYTILKF